ncbi:hypothetical protein GCM10023321_04210 [Pseudonocardia eucalypti]|uniref:Transposase n=1 Tax=Pseudonocardia eucalypti TaxID=648755 RepID=A0ABP9PFL0_9PSEU
MRRGQQRLVPAADYARLAPVARSDSPLGGRRDGTGRAHLVPAARTPFRAIPETCPPGEGMLWIFELFVAVLWSPAARWQPGDRPAGRTRRAHVEGCLRGWAGSGADGAALNK